MKEIVAAKIGTLITTDSKAIVEAYGAGKEVRFLDRQHMGFMAALDLGENWVRLANSRTLFCIDENGAFHAPSKGEEGLTMNKISEREKLKLLKRC